MEAFRKMKQESGGPGGFFVELIHGLGSMPRTMKQLAVVQFFTWTALFCMWIYWTPAIARQVFGGNPSDESGWKLVIEEAGAWTGICFATYNLVCFAFSFVLLGLSRKVSPKSIHMGCLLVGALGLMSVRFIETQEALLGAMVAVGVAWASILSMPYAILASVLPANRMGFYMGVFNFFIVIPQVLVSLVMGKAVGTVFGGDSILAVVFGGGCLLVAALAMLLVDRQGDPVETPVAGGH
jgi:maltose/moltooligosaccharide transporter